MNIAILGTGRMGTGLARGWVKAGHQVTFGSRDPSGNRAAAERIGAGIAGYADAVHNAEAVVIGVPNGSVLEVIAPIRDLLKGKIVIDITNPMDNLPPEGSGAQRTAAAIGAGARVIPAFKATFHGTLGEPTDPATGLARDVFFCGDDSEAKKVVATLIEDLGFRAVDCGPLSRANLLDLMVPLIIEVDGRYNMGRSGSWKLLGRPAG